MGAEENAEVGGCEGAVGVWWRLSEGAELGEAGDLGWDVCGVGRRYFGGV